MVAKFRGHDQQLGHGGSVEHFELVLGAQRVSDSQDALGIGADRDEQQIVVQQGDVIGQQFQGKAGFAGSAVRISGELDRPEALAASDGKAGRNCTGLLIDPGLIATDVKKVCDPAGHVQRQASEQAMFVAVFSRRFQPIDEVVAERRPPPSAPATAC